MRRSSPGPFVIFGMGRSGTSYVAGVLHRSGFHLGEWLKPPDRWNEAGYYEDLDATELHERRLARLAISGSFAAISETFPVDPPAEMRGEVAELIHRRQAHARWAVKPPGILFFWPAWRDALPASTVLIVPFRHPEGVVGSYVAAGDTRERALSLWTQLNRLALQAVDGSPFSALFLNFDDPSGTARRLSSVAGPLRDSYRPDLHHHRPSGSPTEPELASLYTELLRRSA